jgi:hypothetical protein
VAIAIAAFLKSILRLLVVDFVYFHGGCDGPILSNIGLSKELTPFSSFRAIPDYVNHEYSFYKFIEKRVKIISSSKGDGIFVFIYDVQKAILKMQVKEG